MARGSISFRIRMAWWFKPYTYGLAFVAAVTGLEPNWERVQRVISKAMRVDFGE